MDLLPSDRYLARLLGISDEGYAWFKAEARKRAERAPRPAVYALTGFEILAIISAAASLISVGLVIIASFFKPKPSKPAELRVNQEGGRAVTNNQRFAPRFGFNSTQEIATLGSVIPIIYALRENINGIVYGGVRANTLLLWSQIYSLGGSQMLRAIFLMGNGPMESIDEKNFASGDNTLTSYDFGNNLANQVGARMSVYARYANNLNRRIVPDDYIYGRSASEDIGNIANLNSGSSIFDLNIGVKAIRSDRLITFIDVPDSQVTIARTEDSLNFSSSDNRRTITQITISLLGIRLNTASKDIKELYLNNTRYENPVTSQTLSIVLFELEDPITLTAGTYSFNIKYTDDSYFYTLLTGEGILPYFSAAQKPSNQTTFGVYGFCGNDFAMRPNPVFEPQVNAQLVAKGRRGKSKVKCVIDEIKWAQRQKAQAVYSSRSGILTEGLNTIGGITTYKLFSSSDKDTAFGRDVNELLNDSGDQWTTTKSISGISDSSIRSSLLSKLSVSIVAVGFGNTVDVTWTGPTVIDETDNDGENKAYIAVRLSFNSSGLSDAEISALDRSEFDLTFKEELSGDDPEDDVEIEQEHRILVNRDVSYQESALSISALPFSRDAQNAVRNYTTPVYQFDRAEESWTSPTTSYSFTYVSWFSIKNAYIEDCSDIAATVVGRQKTWDDSLIVGELYKIGTGLAVCTNRTDGAFSSEVDFTPGIEGSPQPIEVQFKTVRTGTVDTYTEEHLEIDGRTWLDNGGDVNIRSTFENRNVATTGGHIMRCAIASVSTTRACKVVEIGFKSTLGINIGGITNFNNSRSYNEADDRACLDYKGDIIDKGAVFYTNVFRSNIVSTKAERYSFFYISYRIAGTTSNFIRLNNVYGIRSSTSQSVFNFIQFSMPSIKQWEFQFEPITGYEIRRHITSSLYVLDAGHLVNTTQLIEEINSIKVFFNGTEITRNADSFAINVGRREEEKGELKYPQTDSSYDNNDRSYIDTWGKLAEAFVYEEITSSADGPEHEIVYINEIVPNESTPLYRNLALIGVNISSSVEWQQFSQFSCYVTGGKTCRRLRNDLTVGATHLFPDILLDLLTNTIYGRGDLITDDLINFESFEESANWCYERKYFFDGPIADQVNIRQWSSDTAATFLLRFTEANGKFFLTPDLPFNAVAIKGLFTAGNIVENSFELEYLEPEDRENIQVSVRYREERASTNYDNPGLFPTVREVLVREINSDDTDKLESVDVSDYCTSKNHAIDAAKYIIRKRRISTHTIRFTITHESLTMRLIAGDYIKVAMDETEYDEFNNGGVTPEGALVSTKSLANGEYSILAWTPGSNEELREETLIVSNNSTTATPTNIIFTVLNPITQVRTYQISSITPTEEGSWGIEAVHMPTNAEGILELADGFDTATNWTIRE